MKTKLMIGLLSVLVFAGCSGFNQDPLKDASDAVKGAVDPSTKPFVPRPVSTDVVSLEGTEAKTVVVKEGEAIILPLRVRSYLVNYAYAVEIVNLSEFKGATFDQVTKNLMWTAPRGTSSSGGSVQEFKMLVDIIATPQNGADKTVLKSTQTIIFIVVDEMVKPTIKNVKFSAATIDPLKIAEGSVRYLTVIAEDLEGADAAGMQPKLVLNGLLELYSRVTSTRFVASLNQWEFDVQIDLSNEDITKSITSAPLNIQVANRYGIQSATYLVGFTVLTKLGSALTTFDNSTTLTAGSINSVSFNIYDPQGESVVTLMNVNNLPVGANLTCEKSARAFQQCKLEWSSAVVGPYKTLLEIETRSSNLADTRPPIKSTVAIEYKVIQ